jgi:hypothetical protein
MCHKLVDSNLRWCKLLLLFVVVVVVVVSAVATALLIQCGSYMKIRSIRQVLNEPPLHINHTHFGYFIIIKHFCKKSIIIVNHIYFRVIWVTFTFFLSFRPHSGISISVLYIYIKFILVLLCWAAGWIAHITPREARKYGLVSGKGTIFIYAAT